MLDQTLAQILTDYYRLNQLAAEQGQEIATLNVMLVQAEARENKLCDEIDRLNGYTKEGQGEDCLPEQRASGASGGSDDDGRLSGAAGCVCDHQRAVSGSPSASSDEDQSGVQPVDSDDVDRHVPGNDQ